jgi:phage protein D
VDPVVEASGLPSTDYYAPDFRVEVEGETLDPEAHGDVIELKVMMDMDNMASFDLTVNNWDDKRISLKYSDTSTFDVGRNVHVFMGYAGNLLPMVSGQISTMSPHFPESGSPTLTVGGLDGMAKLRDRKPADGEVTKYTKKRDWEIAQFIARRNDLEAVVTKEGEPYDEIVQKNQDDATFIMERAKRIDYDCFVSTDPSTGKSTLHFTKPADGREQSGMRIYRFVWGESLISFNPTINLSRQVSRVTVRGWDDRKKQAIVASAGHEDLPNAGKNKKGTSGPKAVQSTTSKGKQDVVVDAPVSSEKEAKTLAKALLCERAYQFITGTGQVIGLPDLRPGDNVEMEGLGERFNGLYYVKRVEHVINDAGYRTQFEVRRVFDGVRSEFDRDSA